MTITIYAIPATPQAPRLSPALEIDRHGMLRIAAVSKTAQKCTIVAVPKAPTASGSRIERASAPRVTTTNCRPVNAAAEEPMMTYKLSQATNGDTVAGCSTDLPCELPAAGPCQRHANLP